MSKVWSFLRDSFPTNKSAFSSGLVGAATGALVFLGLLQRHFLGKRYLLYALLISVTVAILAAWLRRKSLGRKFRELSHPFRAFLILATLILTLLLLANTHIQPLYYLMPDTQLTIRIPIGEVPEGMESVRLLWVDTGQDFAHYTNMQFEGEWERVEKNIVFSPNQEVLISWAGKVGSRPEIAFRMTRYNQPVFISWDGIETEYNLNNPKEPNILIQTERKIPFVYQIPFLGSFLVSVGFVVFSLLLLLGTWQPTVKAKRSGKYAWLMYMLPMLLCWGFSLLVFWPGIMSNDSFVLWNQNLTGEYSDWQSAFYAFILAGLIRIWYSPAIVSILQILLLSFLIAWGLRALESQGVPKGLLLVISLLFAISPVNNLFVITLWRDIPYALAVLWLVVILLKVFLSSGGWINRSGWIWLAFSTFLIAILRQNGIPPAFGVLALLPLVYRKHWKAFSASLLLALLLFLGTKGPLYSLLKVDRSKSGQSNLILLHHIAAHLQAGTPLEESEKQYIESFLPITDWNYYCCYVGTISYDNDFKREAFLSSSAQNRQITLSLFTRDPLVDWQHMTCAGELVWRFNNNQCYMKSVHGFNSWIPGEESWVIPNSAGILDNSIMPDIVKPYVDSLRVFGIRDDLLVSYLRPALYLYITLMSAVVLSLRFRDFRGLIICLPLLFQAFVLFLISYAPAFRYQYGTYLSGLFLLAVYFLPSKEDFDS